MAICDYKKALLSLLFIRLTRFLLLIDFLLHIMGIQIQMKWKRGRERDDVVSMWMEFNLMHAKEKEARGEREDDATFRRERKRKFINSAFYRFFIHSFHSHVIPLEHCFK